jgi:hypothetical protein
VDRIREAVCAAIADLGENFDDISERIGIDRGYLRRFVDHGVPRQLPMDVRRRLAAELGLPIGVLGTPSGAPYTAGQTNVAARPQLRVIDGGRAA